MSNEDLEARARRELEQVIPHNYDNFGRLFGGAIGIRNTIEAIITGGILFLIFRIILFSHIKLFALSIGLIVIPIVIVCITGIKGDTFYQFMGNIFRFNKNKKKYRYKRIMSAPSRQKSEVIEVKEKKKRKSKKIKRKSNTEPTEYNVEENIEKESSEMDSEKNNRKKEKKHPKRKKSSKTKLYK